MSLSKEELEEKKHFKKVVQAYRNYNRDSRDRLSRTKDYLKRLPPKHRKTLATNGYEENLKEIERCIDVNYSVIKQFIDGVEKMFENQTNDPCDGKEDNSKTAQLDVEKVQGTLKQFVRDWSEEGEAERDQCYKPILEEIERLFGNLNTAQRSYTKILVPGAGLARLAYEIASRGYECQANEFSLYMLIASNYVLNKCKQKNSCTIYPWIHQYTNNLTIEDQTRAVAFPDIDTSEMPNNANFSMVAGDFLEVYAEESFYGTQDCVVTCFFIDCAHNIVEFIELIHRVLKAGGKWINFGPLLYHFADVPRESSIEPSYDIVRSVIEQTGFQFISEDKDCEATYCQNPRSMLHYTYKCVSFTCMKK